MGQDTHIETRDGWVEITIHRPEKMNAIREQTAAEVLEGEEICWLLFNLGRSSRRPPRAKRRQPVVVVLPPLLSLV